MTGSPVGEELRRYRALAWALVATLIVSVALFVQFLRMERLRVVQGVASDVAHAAAASGMQVALLMERIESIGHDHLMGASDARLMSRLRALELDTALASVCARSEEMARVIHATDERPESVRARCTAPFSSPQMLLSHRDADNLSMDVRLVAMPSGDAPALDVRVHGDAPSELRASLSPATLLDAIALDEFGIDSESVTVCLSLRIGEAFREIACQVGESVAALHEAFRSSGTHAMRMTEDVETLGLRWRIVVTPGARALAGTITTLPFVMFGLAIAVGAVACVFAYRAVDKNIALEARADELRERFAQLRQLEEQNGLLDQFAAMAAHDLQAPIRFIVSQAHLLIAELEELDRPELSRMAASQVEQGERMRALVLDLLEFCRAGQTKLTTAPVDTRAVVDAEARLLRAHEEFAGTRIAVGALPASLVCDGEKFAHIVRNLLGNAVKFSQDSSPPTVSIAARRDTPHGAWTFRVSDNGPGVEARHRELVFRPFSRLDAGPSGTGMGLAIVRIMVERHGGRIWIDPDRTDGSTFCFTMPGAMPTGTTG